jgi:hypothetical protein
MILDEQCWRPGWPDINELTEELREAEEALVAGIKAARTYGTQGTAWALLKADSERVETMRAVLDAAREQGMREERSLTNSQKRLTGRGAPPLARTFQK